MTKRSSWPLDGALERLRAHGLPYRWDVAHRHTWHAVCPSCRVPAWGLTLREHGRGGTLDLRCSAGCTDTAVHVALERDPAEARIEAAEAREARAWEIVEELRTLAVRALELAGSAQSERGHDELAVAA